MHDHARPYYAMSGQSQTTRPGKGGPARHAGRLEEWPQDGAVAGRHPPTNLRRLAQGASQGLWVAQGDHGGRAFAPPCIPRPLP
eukprot:3555857-Lingulodinium_polyedra.AAC.1